MQRTSVRDLREQRVWTGHCHLNSISLRRCKSAERITYISSERVRVRLVFFGQFANNLAQCSSVAAGKNFVRSFV